MSYVSVGYTLTKKIVLFWQYVFTHFYQVQIIKAYMFVRLFMYIVRLPAVNILFVQFYEIFIENQKNYSRL